MKRQSMVLLLCFLPGLSQANDGHDLLDKCQAVVDAENGIELNEVGRIKAAKCLSYLAGFGGADALSPLTHKGRRMFCIPKEVSLNDAARQTVSWMKENEDKLHFGSHEVLAMSNIVNYPCVPERK